MRSFTLLLAVTLALPALADDKPMASPFGDFVDTRLTFGFGDDDILKAAGESTPSSPAANFVPGAQNTQFFDNYETKTSGFDNFSNIVVWRKLPTYFAGLDADAALALRISQNALFGVAGTPFVRDESSYIRLSYRPEGWGEKDGLQFVGFPLSADRFRLGYSYRISWGGNRINPPGRAQPVPGMKLQFTRGALAAYLGMKTAQILNPKINEEETNYSYLGGVSYNLSEELKLEANGGFFSRGKNPLEAVLGLPVQTIGGSAQASYSVGQTVGTSIDFALYKNDPTAPVRFFKPEKYPGGLSWTVAAESTAVATTLADPDPSKSGSTVWQPGFAGDLQARAKYDFLRVHLTAMVRNLAFLTLNQTSVTPNIALPADLDRTSELFVAIGADYHIPSIHLTPGVVFGFQQPASFTSPKLSDVIGNNPVLANLGRRSVVVREDPSFADRILQDILPSDCGAAKDEACTAAPILGAKLTTKLDIGDAITAAGELFTTYNPNRVRFADNIFGVAQRVYDSPMQIGFTMLLSARY